MVKMGKITLTEAEADRFYMAGKRYFAINTAVYVLDYSTNAGYHGRAIYKSPAGYLTKRNKPVVGDERQVNKLLGFKLLNEV